MQGKLSDRDKVAHLLRRFGFGASNWEMEKYAPLGPGKTLDALLKVDLENDHGVHPLRFAFREKEDADPGAYRFRNFWTYQMLVTQTPLREKMALFWHSHFAVSDNKVENGLAMLDYLHALRKDPLGKFEDILVRMCQCPAVLYNLDVRLITKARPNENFAREVMELYTVGIGNYTEQDIKEIAKAFTGWLTMNTYWEMKGNNEKKLRFMMENQTPFTFFAYAPGVHLEGQKTVLGKAVDDGYDVLKLLATHSKTAEFLCGKLWRFFVSDKPDPAGVKRLAAKFRSSGGSISATLREMASLPQFWAPEVVGGLVKNPVDYAVGMCRAMNTGPEILARTKMSQPFHKPMESEAADPISNVTWNMEQMGLDLFYPETVAGWEPGPSWINTNNLNARRKFEGLFTWVKTKVDGKDKWVPGPTMAYVVDQITIAQPATPLELAKAICNVFDYRLSDFQLTTLVPLVEKRGGVKALEKKDAAVYLVESVLRIVRNAPEAHLC